MQDVKNMMPKAGVMGWPVAHSRSPRLHEFWLRHHHIEGSYDALPVRPEELPEALKTLRSKGFRGCNLTIPHKEAALKLVDHLDPLALRIGAVNLVVVRHDGNLEGRNTDAFGFAENLRAAGCDLAAGPALVLGAGGAARAILIALQDALCPRIYLTNRTRDRAEKLAAACGGPIEIIEWDERAAPLDKISLLINTTSLGMQGQPPLDLDLARLAPDAVVTDIVYAPLQTDLLRRAAARGNKTVDGLGMLLHQARPAFAAWFGVMPDVTDEVRAHVVENA